MRGEHVGYAHQKRGKHGAGDAPDEIEASHWRCSNKADGARNSRGAAEVVLLEREASLVASLLESKARLDAAAVRVERADALQWMARSAPGAFDLVLLDPPFDLPLAAPAMTAASRIVAPGGFVYVEAPRPIGGDAVAGLEPWRMARAGAVHFHLFRRAAAA